MPYTPLIRAVPKSDLHVHLDGSLRLGTLIDLARSRGVRLPSMDEEGLLDCVFKKQYACLLEYLACFACTCRVLQDAEALERVACELAEDSLAEAVRVAVAARDLHGVPVVGFDLAGEEAGYRAGHHAAAFFPGTYVEKRVYVGQAASQFDRLAAEMRNIEHG